MGLDMNLCAIDPIFVSPDKKYVDGDFAFDICYWSKYGDLHQWMKNLHRDCGGTGNLDCVKLFLTKANLDRLKQDIINNKLPCNKEEYFDKKEYTLEAIEKAKECIEEGFLVYYTAS